MVWVALAGNVLQVFGLRLAVVGVSETYRESVDRDLWEAVRSDLGRWLRRTILRKPRDRSVTLGVASSMHGHGSMHAFGQQRPPKPADDAPTEEQLAYLTRYVEALSEELVATRAQAKELIREAERRIGTRIDEVSARVDHTNESLRSLRTAFVGNDGVGLRRAAVGLSVTLFGVVLTTAGLPW